MDVEALKSTIKTRADLANVLEVGWAGVTARAWVHVGACVCVCDPHTPPPAQPQESNARFSAMVDNHRALVTTVTALIKQGDQDESVSASGETSQTHSAIPPTSPHIKLGVQPEILLH